VPPESKQAGCRFPAAALAVFSGSSPLPACLAPYTRGIKPACMGGQRQRKSHKQKQKQPCGFVAPDFVFVRFALSLFR